MDYSDTSLRALEKALKLLEGQLKEDHLAALRALLNSREFHDINNIISVLEEPSQEIHTKSR